MRVCVYLSVCVRHKSHCANARDDIGGHLRVGLETRRTAAEGEAERGEWSFNRP